MPLLEKLDPEGVNPTLLVNRSEVVERVSAQLASYIRSGDKESGQSLLLLGDKGVGKSIVTRAILDRVREGLSSCVLFVVIDCRRIRTWIEGLRAIISALLVEVDEVRKLFPGEVTGELRAIVAMINEIVRWDNAELKQLKETLVRVTASAKLSGSLAISHAARYLKAEMSLDVSTIHTSTSAFSGTLRLDERRINGMLSAAIRDLVEAGWRPLIYLDNVDELDHRYSTDEERKEVRREVEGILSLKEAPVVLLMNMRSYFATAFNRVATRNELIEHLPAEELLKMLRSRVAGESLAVRGWFDGDDVQAGLQGLVRVSGSPFALLKWFRFLAERDRLRAMLDAASAELYVKNHYASVPLDDIKNVVRVAFAKGATSVSSRADLLAACGGDETLLVQLIELQAVLPVDFWNPIRFTLDPELHPLHALWTA